MKKKIGITLTSVALLFLVYYYWQNRYVELRPVVPEEILNRPVFFPETFHNQLFKFAEPNEVPKYYYKNIRWVLDRSSVDYIEKNGIIYVRNKFLNDMEMVWNYTTRTSNIEWFKSQREMDSVNGNTENQTELDSIIKNLR
ncbi:hypothetical protein BC749_104344 [Flavobacterium araucananum]|uniref:Uncharacterized protein n=1 Tax=Flavobacterium araucananum TaxID=946678 RepID=A0A227PEH3_9FLAO|nr:hypothetical protein [Flavobacterium araucananum]OXG08289.1 hypothetical protein B0A64_05870 [Flavobacterium araucananum]PWJ99186.1 hypothetical protein BC749_104344 [Flavobacterium araucananum]